MCLGWSECATSKSTKLHDISRKPSYAGNQPPHHPSRLLRSPHHHHHPKIHLVKMKSHSVFKKKKKSFLLAQTLAEPPLWKPHFDSSLSPLRFRNRAVFMLLFTIFPASVLTPEKLVGAELVNCARFQVESWSESEKSSDEARLERGDESGILGAIVCGAMAWI